MPRLGEHFAGVVIKRLYDVETDPCHSNQHELHGTNEMKRLFGLARRQPSARFIYIAADDDQRLSVDDTVTWYDARASNPKRSEHRLYYSDNEVMDQASTGDVLIIGLRHDSSVVLLIVDSESPDLTDILWLFGTRESDLGEPLEIDPETIEQRSLALFNRIAETAGLDIEPEVSDNWLDLLLDRFGERFPTTRDLSALALETLHNDISAVDDPDGALLDLVDREEVLFRQLERHIVSGYLEEHAQTWASDVDAFVSFSLGVHNRRKSRAGHALENQLEWILQTNEIRFVRGATTEGRSKPDFLFPGAAEYHDPAMPSANLTMLGVKTSCRDRWRQVLNEAARIPRKHLLTLQPAISEHQTGEMELADLTLVVPAGLHSSFTAVQQDWLLSLCDFMHIVRRRDS